MDTGDIFGLGRDLLLPVFIPNLYWLRGLYEIIQHLATRQLKINHDKPKMSSYKNKPLSLQIDLRTILEPECHYVVTIDRHLVDYGKP